MGILDPHAPMENGDCMFERRVEGHIERAAAGNVDSDQRRIRGGG